MPSRFPLTLGVLSLIAGCGGLPSADPECQDRTGIGLTEDDCYDIGAIPGDQDLDGDGLLNCEDSDLDGDGLRNVWDAVPDDDGITRGPIGGFEFEEDLEVDTDRVFDEFTQLADDAEDGADHIVVRDGDLFEEGDELLVLAQQGDGAGTYEFVFVASAEGDVVDIEPLLQNDYDSADVVLVQKVPHYNDVHVSDSGSLRAAGWQGEGGGVIAFRATGEVNVDGQIDASGAGFRGGDGVMGLESYPLQGESFRQVGEESMLAPNDGGGGSAVPRTEEAESGGGGGYGTSGQTGRDFDDEESGQGGEQYGSPDLAQAWFIGSGGGAGAPDDDAYDGYDTNNISGAGGSGGGLIAVYSRDKIIVGGEILTDGTDGLDGHSAGAEVGGGGGGSGGQIWLVAPDLEGKGYISAVGGFGGLSDYNATGEQFGWSEGGEGGVGRIRIDYDSESLDREHLTPDPGFEGDYEENWETPVNPFHNDDPENEDGGINPNPIGDDDGDGNVDLDEDGLTGADDDAAEDCEYPSAILAGPRLEGSGCAAAPARLAGPFALLLAGLAALRRRR